MMMSSAGLALHDETMRLFELPRMEAGGLSLHLARTEEELAALQRLRFRVFTEDMGANFPDAQGDRDVDRFDPWCIHFMVRDISSGDVVGTYRLLTPEAAELSGGYYSESEFDLAPLADKRARLVEVGRSCIDAGFRDGTAIMLLWAGLAQIMMRGNYLYMLGCASVSLQDGGATASAVWRKAQQLIAARPELPQVRPLVPYPLDKLDIHQSARIPPLIKGYLQIGCTICGEPAFDPDFYTADFPILLDLEWLDPRYRRHFGMG